MNLRQLLDGLVSAGRPDLLDRDISGLCVDSRRLRPGDAFFCVPGATSDGNDFLPEAFAAGAAVAIGSRVEAPEGRGYVRVEDVQLALALAAQRFYREPSRELRLVGVTGTCGKTTTVHTLESILTAAGVPTGRLGTIGHRYLGQDIAAPSTCPQAHELARLLRDMADAGVDAVVMEATSHALAQRRTDGCRWEAVAFTNLSREHLDFHADMNAYLAAKRRLFEDYEVTAGAAFNVEDPIGRQLRAHARMRTFGYGEVAGADIRSTDVVLGADGIRAVVHTPGGQFRLDSSLRGRFNLHNLLAATAIAVLMNVGVDDIAEGVHRLRGIPGRLEDVGGAFGRRVFVDYAHTPAALAQALQAVKPSGPGRLICVFGCGGDRDQGKRPAMGRAAAQQSDLSIVTSDNSRSERTADIIAEIEPGLRSAGARRVDASSPAVARERGVYAVIEDRIEAIRTAIAVSTPEDTVVLCGKGHETSQLIGTRKLPLDDREVAREALRTTNRP